MGTIDAAVRVDERAIGTGTTLRFVLLLVLVCTVTTAIVSNFLVDLAGAGSWDCELAAGGDPNRPIAEVMLAIGNANWVDKVGPCSAARHPLPAWWWPPLAVAVLLLVAGGLFVLMPWWKIRQRSLVGLELVDPAGLLRRRLAELVAVAKLPTPPRFVVDPVAASAGAVVFGRNGRPTVCLHGALLTKTDVGQRRFRAVVLHELAHIRNRDVTITYLTVALWRTFVTLILVPEVLHTIYKLTLARSPFLGDTPTTAAHLIRALILAALVYLARAEVLRHRETCADRSAVLWGADPRGWVFTPAPRPESYLSRWGHAFTDLWRTHPRWKLRQQALTDPASLFGAQPLTFFLTGAVARLASTQLTFYTGTFLSESSGRAWWVDGAVAFFITAIAGLSLHRAVIYAYLTGEPLPNALSAGLWLGVGFLTIDLIPSDSTWWQRDSWVLLFSLGAGVFFGVWIVESATLWTRVWPGQSVRPLLLLTLVPAGLLLAGWLTWWDGWAYFYTSGLRWSGSAWRDYFTQRYASIPGHEGEKLALGYVYPYLLEARGGFLVSGMAAVWGIPALAWIINRDKRIQPWARWALRGRVQHSPRQRFTSDSRSIVRPVILGTLVCLAGNMAVRAYMHTWWPLASLQRAGLFGWITYLWLLAALAVGALATAIATNVSARSARLVAAVVAVQTTLVLGAMAILAFNAADGCIGPLDTFTTACRVHPPQAELLRVLATSILAGGLLIAALTTAIFAVVRRVSRLRPRFERQGQKEIRPQRRWVGVVLATVIVAVIAQTEWTTAAPAQGTRQPDVAQLWSALNGPTYQSSPQIRAVQVLTWAELGGMRLLERYAQIDDLRGQFGTPGQLRHVCGMLWAEVDDAEKYLPVPHPELQTLWKEFLTDAATASRHCVAAIDSITVPYTSDSTEAIEESDRAAQLRTAGQELDAATDAALAVIYKMNSLFHDALGSSWVPPQNQQPR